MISIFKTITKRLIREKKIQAIKKHGGCDIICPSCNQWFAISTIDHSHVTLSKPGDLITSIECGVCDTVSHWRDDLIPGMIRCTEKGSPII